MLASVDVADCCSSLVFFLLLLMFDVGIELSTLDLLVDVISVAFETERKILWTVLKHFLRFHGLVSPLVNVDLQEAFCIRTSPPGATGLFHHLDGKNCSIVLESTVVAVSSLVFASDPTTLRREVITELVVGPEGMELLVLFPKLSRTNRMNCCRDQALFQLLLDEGLGSRDARVLCLPCHG